MTVDALDKFEIYTKALLKDVSYDIACWKSTAATPDTWVANTDQFTGAAGADTAATNAKNCGRCKTAGGALAGTGNLGTDG